MKKISYLMLAFMALCISASFTACGDDDERIVEKIVNDTVTVRDTVIVDNNWSRFQQMVNEEVMAKKKNEKAILVVAFGSTWQQAFDTFDKVKSEYESEFNKQGYDVFLSFSSAICITQAAAGEHAGEGAEVRLYFDPEHWLTAFGMVGYKEIVVQSLQVIPGEEFAAVVASVKKFMNNGYLGQAHLDDAYLAKLAEDEAIFLGMPLLNDPDVDVPAVAQQLSTLYAAEAQQGVVAFMGHGNPDNYDTFKANIRYSQLEQALQAVNPKFFVGTVDMAGNYKQDVMDRMKNKGFNSGKVYLHALMSIAGDHAHNDMAGEGEDYWDASEPESEENSWYEFFGHNNYDPIVPVVGNHPQGLLELPGILNVWISHTRNAEFLEDAYHSMYPEE